MSYPTTVAKYTNRKHIVLEGTLAGGTALFDAGIPFDVKYVHFKQFAINATGDANIANFQNRPIYATMSFLRDNYAFVFQLVNNGASVTYNTQFVNHVYEINNGPLNGSLSINFVDIAPVTGVLGGGTATMTNATTFMLLLECTD